jgi:hypothetical protein
MIDVIDTGLLAVPWGFRQLLNHVHKQYAGPNGLGIIITENGFAIQDEAERTLEQIVDDKERQEYYDLYITELCQAHKEGIKMEGYLGWSLVEWVSGRSPVRKVPPNRATADVIVSTRLATSNGIKATRRGSVSPMSTEPTGSRGRPRIRPRF